jgi:hypothetical protein
MPHINISTIPQRPPKDRDDRLNGLRDAIKRLLGEKPEKIDPPEGSLGVRG